MPQSLPIPTTNRAAGQRRPGGPDLGSCATVFLSQEGNRVVGHNLDERFEVPGLVVINPRGERKRSVAFSELLGMPRLRKTPHLNWVSRYGSLTCNVFGRGFPDGGLNEAGLYVGEMTLLSTVWPSLPGTVRMYHHQWIQYLLDNHATVNEALGSLGLALPEGHCRWHFFLADRTGNAAVVEFIEGRPTVYRGESLPYPLVCNSRYDEELQSLESYMGFGGGKDPAAREAGEDPRFRWAAAMLRDYAGEVPAKDYAFRILDRLDLGSRKWSVVCDLVTARLSFCTSHAPREKWVGLSAFDLGRLTHPRALDIHTQVPGDAAHRFTDLTLEWNRQAIARAWEELPLGFLGRAFLRPAMIRGMARFASELGVGSV
mgnify:CR=1 FL=1